MSNFLLPNRPPRKKVRSIDEIIAEEKRREAQNPKGDKPLKQGPDLDLEPDNPDITGSIDFSIQKISEGYRVSGIQYQKKFCTYDFAENVLPRKNQEKHADRALNAKKDDFIAASAPLVYSVCKTLNQNKDSKQKSLVEKARKSLNKIIGPGKPWIHTLSRAVYKTRGLDEVIHDYKQKKQYSKQAKLVGPDGYITKQETQAESTIKAVFDTNDSMQEINNVFQWITDKNSYTYRINSTPDSEQVRAVVLGVNGNDYFDIYTFSVINVNRPAFGVRRKKFSTGNEGSE